MKRASAIVTNRGGRTVTPAIIARELGISGRGRLSGDDTTPHQATRSRGHRRRCSEGDTGHVYAGRPGNRGQRSATRRDAAVQSQDHDERRQSAAGVRLCADAQWRRAGSLARLEFHHQQQHRRASARHPGLRSRDRRGPEVLRSNHCPGAYPSPRAFYQGQARRGHRDHRREFLAQARHRAAPRTSSRTNTASSSAAPATSREEENRCWASAASAATSSKDFGEAFGMGAKRSSLRAGRDGADQCADHGPVRACTLSQARTVTQMLVPTTASSAVRTNCRSS